MEEQFPDMLVGAGTVLTKEQVDAAAAADATSTTTNETSTGTN